MLLHEPRSPRQYRRHLLFYFRMKALDTLFMKYRCRTHGTVNKEAFPSYLHTYMQCRECLTYEATFPGGVDDIIPLIISLLASTCC